VDPGGADRASSSGDLHATDWFGVPGNSRRGLSPVLAGRLGHLTQMPRLVGAAGLVLAGVVLVASTVGRGAGAAWSGIDRDAASEAASGAPSVAGAAASPAGPAADEIGGGAGTWTIDVAGAVVRPGVYRLPAGSRVGDAVAAAGGFSPDVDARQVETSMNLAEPLQDGTKVLVPVRAATGPPEAQATSGSSPPPAQGGLVNLNDATQAQLDTLPGIGPVTAKRIIESRAGSRFASIDDFAARKLVNASVLEKIRPLVAVGD
jgi:competence protein ComEA